MLLLRHIRGLIIERGSAGDYETAWSRARTGHEFIFVVIESSIVLGAIQSGLHHQFSWLLSVAYMIAYTALGTYILTGLKYAGALYLDSKGILNRSSRWVAVFSLFSFLVSFSLPYFLGGIVASIVAAHIST